MFDPWVGKIPWPNGRGGWTPLRPLGGLQETRVATREESGVLGFPSRLGLTPQGCRTSESGPGWPPQCWMAIQIVRERWRLLSSHCRAK